MVRKLHHFGTKGFLDFFVNPVIRNKPDIQIGFKAVEQKIHFEDLIKSKENFLVLGKDKTGKTSLLYKIQLDLLTNYIQEGIIPFYFDYKDHRVKSNNVDFLKLFSQFIESNRENTIEILKTYRVLLLIDNFNPGQSEITNKLASFLKSFPNCNYISVSDQTIINNVEKLDYGINEYTQLYITDINRSEIRKLIEKWPDLPLNKKEDLIDKLIQILRQHNLPFNFWTLSVFLWIFSAKNAMNINSNSELIELYIDDLLDRARLASDPYNRFTYGNYRLLLSELAYHLLTKKFDQNYSMKYSELVAFIENFMVANPRRVGNVSEIASYLLDHGILKKREEDVITFRLNGVFEYFIAYSFIENRDFMTQILNDDNVYLSFKNEFELYSGFQKPEKESEDFLKIIFRKTKSAFAELNERSRINDLDKVLVETIGSRNFFDLTESINQIAESSKDSSLSTTEKDRLIEEFTPILTSGEEVKPKKLYDVSVKNFEILERFLVINGRVFKNSDNIKNEELVEEIFDFIIDSACALGFFLIEELERDLDEWDHKSSTIDLNNPDKSILLLITNYLPNVVQGFVYDAIGHVNLEGIINRKLLSLKLNSKSNQFKIFVLYLLLIDSDLKKYNYLIGELISLTELGAIKSALLLKLSYYMLFKAYDDDDLIIFLKENIRKLQLNINPDTDIRELNAKLSKADKIILLRRGLN